MNGRTAWLNGLLTGILCCVALGWLGQAETPQDNVLMQLQDAGYPLGHGPWTIDEPAEPFSMQHGIQAARHRAKTQTYMLNEMMQQRQAMERLAGAAETLASDGLVIETTPPDLQPLIDSVGRVKTELQKIRGVPTSDSTQTSGQPEGG